MHPFPANQGQSDAGVTAIGRHLILYQADKYATEIKLRNGHQIPPTARGILLECKRPHPKSSKWHAQVLTLHIFPNAVRDNLPLQLRQDGWTQTPIEITPRIGIRHAADLPLRFALAGNACVSRIRSSGNAV